jgi:hypothetical protein
MWINLDGILLDSDEVVFVLPDRANLNAKITLSTGSTQLLGFCSVVALDDFIESLFRKLSESKQGLIAVQNKSASVEPDKTSISEGNSLAVDNVIGFYLEDSAVDSEDE